MRAFVLPCLVLLGLALSGRINHALLAGLGVLLLSVNYFWNRRFREGIKRNPLREAIFKVALPTMALCLLNGKSVSSYDNYGIGLTAANLVTRGKVELSPLLDCQKDSGYFFRCREGGGAYTVYPVGNLVLAVPTFALARIFLADLDNHKVIWRISKLTASLVAGACAAIFFLIALKLGSPGAYIVTLFLVTGSALFSTVGQGLWSHDGVLLFFLIALYLLLARPALGDLTFGIIFGLCLSLMFASRVTSAALIPPLGIWLLTKSFPRALLAGVAAVVFFLPWAYFHHHEFGHFLGPQYGIAAENAGLISIANYKTSLYGLLFSPGSGLFIFQPWALLLFCAPLSKDSPYRFWLLALCSSLLALMGLWKEWSGQICYGTRYLTEIIPLVALLILPAAERLYQSRKGKALLIVLGLFAFAIQANGVFGQGMNWYHHPKEPGLTNEQRAMDWSDPAFAYPLFR